MSSKTWILVSIVGFICLGIGWELGSKQTTRQGISARTVGDYLHAVIEADRTFYTQHVVERMEAMLIVTASENWREEKTLPLPVQFLREASRGLHIRDAPFRYRSSVFGPSILVIRPHQKSSSEPSSKLWNMEMWLKIR